MLSDADMDRIRLEEIFRNQIRIELAKAVPGSTFTTSFWTFLNSTFGLWLLSAIFITGAGTVFTYWQHKHAENLKEQDAVERLDLEIGYRFSQVLIRLYDLTDKQDMNHKLASAHTRDDVKVALNILRESPSKTITPLYPDFSRLGIPSLMAELQRHVKDDHVRQEIGERLSQVTGNNIEDSNGTDLTDVRRAAATILGELMLPRWRNGSFFFTDCDRTDPFC